MVIIRLLRIGKRNQPYFKIVVTDKRRPPKGGRFLESVGFWNPLTKEKNFKTERIKYWLSKGAKTSDTVHNLLISEKIVEGRKIPKHKKTKEKKAPKEEKAEVKKETKEAPEKPKEAKAAKEEKPEEEKPKEKETKGKEAKESSRPEPEKEKPKKETKEAPKEKPKEKVKETGEKSEIE